MTPGDQLSLALTLDGLVLLAKVIFSGSEDFFRSFGAFSDLNT